MDSKEVFSRNLNYYMNERGKSRTDVADAIGVSYFTFTDWVKGKKFPRMDKVEKLAKYFNVKISDLIEPMKTHPVELAELHVEMLQDEDMVEIYTYLKNLSTKKRAVIKDLARSLSED